MLVQFRSICGYRSCQRLQGGRCWRCEEAEASWELRRLEQFSSRLEIIRIASNTEDFWKHLGHED